MLPGFGGPPMPPPGMPGLPPGFPYPYGVPPTSSTHPNHPQHPFNGMPHPGMHPLMMAGKLPPNAKLPPGMQGMPPHLPPGFWPPPHPGMFRGGPNGPQFGPGGRPLHPQQHQFQQQQHQFQQQQQGRPYRERKQCLPSTKTISDFAFDPYAGLMSKKEREWLIKIQLIQCLGTGDPWDDDYYYSVGAGPKI